MRLLKFFTVCVLLGQVQTAFADLGFLTVSDSKIPATVRQAAQSVYLFEAGAGDKTALVDLHNPVNLAHNEAALKGDDKWWQKGQLDTCLISKESPCQLFRQQGVGSAFLLGSSQRLVTVLHNIVEELSARLTTTKSMVSLVNSDPFFALSDASGGALYNPTKSVAKLTLFPPVIDLLVGGIGLMNEPRARLADYVEISLPVSTGPALKLTASPAKIGERLFLIGYPAQTTDRHAFGGEDSDGDSERVSIGNRISIDDFEKITGESFPSELRAIADANLLFGNFDCEHGDSGGAVVNSRGEVEGILVAKYGQLPNRACLAIRNFDRQRLLSMWKFL